MQFPHMETLILVKTHSSRDPYPGTAAPFASHSSIRGSAGGRAARPGAHEQALAEQGGIEMAETAVETSWSTLFEGKGSLETVSPAPADIAVPVEAVPANRCAQPSRCSRRLS